jgi:hypothetical protein
LASYVSTGAPYSAASSSTVVIVDMSLLRQKGRSVFDRSSIRRPDTDACQTAANATA